MNVAGFSGDGGPATSAELNAPQGLAIDGAGDLLIGDSQNNRVRSVAGIANVAAVPVASFQPSSLTFMSQPLTIKSTAQVVTLTNNGGATLTGIVDHSWSALMQLTSPTPPPARQRSLLAPTAPSA